MSSINTGRVIGAGLVAGVALNVGDMGVQYLMADEAAAMVGRLHLDPALMTMTLANGLPWIVVDFILGILIVLNYAAMRPRFGAGPKTAVLAGLILYGAVTAVLYGFTTMGIFTQGMFVKSSAFWAVNVAIGSLAGGWAYKEK